MIEILISVVIFSAVILALAGLAFQVARRSTRSTDATFIMATLQSRVDLAATVAFDSLTWINGCDTTTTGTVQIIGCTAVTATTPKLSSILVTVRTNVPGGRPDTIALTRAKPRLAIPLL